MYDISVGVEGVKKPETDGIFGGLPDESGTIVVAAVPTHYIVDVRLDGGRRVGLRCPMVFCSWENLVPDGVAFGGLKDGGQTKRPVKGTPEKRRNGDSWEPPEDPFRVPGSSGGNAPEPRLSANPARKGGDPGHLRMKPYQLVKYPRPGSGASHNKDRAIHRSPCVDDEKAERGTNGPLQQRFPAQRFLVFAGIEETTGCFTKIICVKRCLHDLRFIVSAAADSLQNDRS